MKYEVTIKEIEIYKLDIDAEDENEAVNKAYELLDVNGRAKYHQDSDGESEVYELD